MASQIDKQKLLAHLNQKVKSLPPSTVPRLVAGAVLEGLVTAIKRGDFDVETEVKTWS